MSSGSEYARQVNERFAPLREKLARSYRVAFFERLEAHLAALSKGDRAIVYALAAIVVIATTVGLYALEQKLLVPIPAYGGTLVEGAVGSPRFVHPLLAISDADRDLTALTYAGLMGISGGGALVSVIAESYEISPDGKTYTFTIREDAAFSDGTSITADDVVFTVQKAQDPSLKSPEFANWSGVTALAEGTRTVSFTLAKPYAPFLENTTLGILPARLWRGIPVEQFPFSALTLEPVGAGPFKPARIVRDASGLVENYALVANARYPLGRPYLSSIKLRFFSRDEDLSKALANGSVDSTYGRPEGGTLTAPYARVFGVFFNSSSNAVFARLEVRKALSLALDRSIIAQQVLGGYATPLIGPVPPGSDITPTSVPSFADQTAEAARILENNGWRYDRATRAWVQASAKLSLERFTVKTSNVPELKAVASAVKADWERLGIPIDIELYEPGDLNQNVIRPRKYDALLFGMVVGRDKDLYAFWSSQERNDPGLNIALYANKTVDALLEEARQTSDPKERLADLQKIEDAIAADYPAAFTHAPHFVYLVPTELRGVALPQITTPSDRFAAVREWHVRTESVWPFFIPNP